MTISPSAAITSVVGPTTMLGETLAITSGLPVRVDLFYVRIFSHRCVYFILLRHQAPSGPFTHTPYTNQNAPAFPIPAMTCPFSPMSALYTPEWSTISALVSTTSRHAAAGRPYTVFGSARDRGIG